MKFLKEYVVARESICGGGWGRDASPKVLKRVKAFLLAQGVLDIYSNLVI